MKGIDNMNEHACNAQERPLKIALVGDSTVTDESGWGRAFADRFNNNLEILNFAVGGRSSKSWYEEDRLPSALNARPAYVLIQFGHNDQPGKGPERETDPATRFRDYLSLYVNAFRKIGTKPVLISPVTRRTFNENGEINSTLMPWAEATHAVAQELRVPFIDLHKASVTHYNKIGQEASMAFNPKEEDVSHFNMKGANAITDLILNHLTGVVPELTAYWK